MRRSIRFLTTVVCIFIFCSTVVASSGNISVSSNSIYVGDSFTTTVNIMNSASWNVHVSATGPVSGCEINEEGSTEDITEANKMFTATCTSTGEGQITVSLNGNLTSASGEEIVLSEAKTVTVSKKAIEQKASENNNSSISTITDTTTTPTDNKSTNNNLKEIKAEGFELTKVDNSNYSLTVPNAISSIKLLVTAEDKRAIIGGNGTHKLHVGENEIEVTIISEAGHQNKIYVKVTRKEINTLEDLESILKYDFTSGVTIIIDKDTIIKSNIIEAIKDSNKTIFFNYSDDGQIIYSWIIDGSKIDDVNDFLTTVAITDNGFNNIKPLAKYNKGLLINIEDLSGVPYGSMLKIYVGNNYDDDDKLQIYSYENESDELKIVNSKTVKDGFIELILSEDSNYFLTNEEESVDDIAINETKGSTGSKVLIMVIITIIVVALIGTGIFFIIKKKKKNRKFTTTYYMQEDEIENIDNHIEEIK